jgi:general secretion pathway protein C
MLTLLVWALLAASVAYWGLRLFTRPLPVPAQAVAVAEGAPPVADLSRLLGRTGQPAAAEAAAEPPPDARFRLLGVVAPKSGLAAQQHEGVALIAIDGAPPRAVRVGAAVEGDFRLLSVDARSAALGRGGVVAVKLQLEAPAPAATGTPATMASPMPPNAPPPVMSTEPILPPAALPQPGAQGGAPER